MKHIKKVISLVLCFILIFSVTIQQSQHSASASSKETKNPKINIIEDSEEFLKLETKLSGVKGILTLNKETYEISLTTSEKSKKTGENKTDYKINLITGTNEKIEGTIINLETDEKFEINTDGVSASIPLIVGVVIGAELLANLIGLGLAVTILGVTYLTYTEFIKKSKSYSHYMAILKDGKLWVGNGLTLAKAASHLKNGGNTWSTSKTNSQNVAKTASPLSQAIGHEIDGGNPSGKYYHYHPVSHLNGLGLYERMYVNNKAVHAFYGGPQ